jgi:hypothetical protein
VPLESPIVIAILATVELPLSSAIRLGVIALLFHVVLEPQESPIVNAQCRDTVILPLSTLLLRLGVLAQWLLVALVELENQIVHVLEWDTLALPTSLIRPGPIALWSHVALEANRNLTASAL